MVGLLAKRAKDRDIPGVDALDPDQSVLVYADADRAHSYRSKFGFHISEAIELDPNNAMYYCARGSALVRDHQYEKAIADCTQSLKLNPFRVHPYMSRGMAYTRLGKYKLALQDLNEAIRRLPNYGEAYFERAMVNDLIGNKPQSKRDLKKAYKYGYQSPEAMR